MAKFGEDATREAQERFGIKPPPEDGGFAIPEGYRDLGGKSLTVDALVTPDGTPAVTLEIKDAAGRTLFVAGIAPEEAMGIATKMTQAAGALLGPEKFEAESKRILARLEEELKKAKYGL